MTMSDLRWVVEQFKGYKREGLQFLDRVIINTWFREPDYADNYRQLWALEKEMSTGPDPIRRELASVWRLARDKDYAPWLKNVGVETVQITLFGLEQNTDYFTGRKGAFKDCLAAIDLLLQNSIAPRIQIFPFATTPGDLEPLRKLLSKLRLENRVLDIGKEFDCFLNTPSPTGAGYNLENIRLGKEHLNQLPSYFMEKTVKHFKVESIGHLWQTEVELLPLLIQDDKPLKDEPSLPAFVVTPDFSVYPNCGEIADWWRLGNLKADGIDAVMDTYLRHANPGLYRNYHMPVSYFARKYGDREGSRLYSKVDLVQKWFMMEMLAGGTG